MKLLLFTDTIADLNGVSRFLQDMAEAALKNGDPLHIIASTNKDLPQLANIHNFKPKVSFPMPYYKELKLSFPPAKQIKEFTKNFEADLIHISTPGPVGLLGKKIAKELNIPILGTYHTDFPAYIKDQTGMQLLKRLTDKWMEKFYKPFLHVFSRSEYYVEVMHKDIGIDRSKTSIIPQGTNLSKFSKSHADESLWDRYNIPKKPLKALYVGRISKEKNVPFLLEVWKEFKTKHPKIDVVLVMAGVGSVAKETKKMHDFGVYHLGAVVGDVLSKLYANSDFFLFPSLTDTLGQVVMEASASEMSVVVSHIGGPKTLLNPQEQSGHALSCEIPLWVEVIKSLSTDQTQRLQYGQAANRYMRQFPIENSYKSFIGLHKEYFKQLS